MSKAFEVIPAIDLIDGKCVRLTQGDFNRKIIYSENPLEVAQTFEAAGIKRLHVVDLDGAKSGKLTNLTVLRKIAKSTNLAIDFGGGIKTDEDVEAVFESGAEMINIGSAAVNDPEKFFTWLEKFGSNSFLLGADVRSEKIAIDGWQTTTEIEIVSFLKSCFERGVTKAFVTDISKDGAMNGSALELYSEILVEVPKLNLIASGGVSSIEDILEIKKIGCSGAIVGKAIYEGKVKLEELVKI